MDENICDVCGCDIAQEKNEWNMEEEYEHWHRCEACGEKFFYEHEYLTHACEEDEE
jgi:hypothetical protein